MFNLVSLFQETRARLTVEMVSMVILQTASAKYVIPDVAPAQMGLLLMFAQVVVMTDT